MPSNTTDVLEHRVTSLERAYEQTNAALRGIDESLRTLAQTKADMTRAHDSINDHEARLRAVEKDMPSMRIVTKHIIAGVVAVVGAVAVAAGKILFGH